MMDGPVERKLLQKTAHSLGRENKRSEALGQVLTILLSHTIRFVPFGALAEEKVAFVPKAIKQTEAAGTAVKREVHNATAQTQKMVQDVGSKAQEGVAKIRKHVTTYAARLLKKSPASNEDLSKSQ